MVLFMPPYIYCMYMMWVWYFNEDLWPEGATECTSEFLKDPTMVPYLKDLVREQHSDGPGKPETFQEIDPDRESLVALAVSGCDTHSLPPLAPLRPPPHNALPTHSDIVGPCWYYMAESVGMVLTMLAVFTMATSMTYGACFKRGRKLYNHMFYFAGKSGAVTTVYDLGTTDHEPRTTNHEPRTTQVGL